MRKFLASTALALSLGLGSAAIAQTAPATGATPPATTAPGTSATTAPGAAAATTAAPSAATGKVTQGATVYDAQGGTVGTIDAVDAQHATIATATSKTKVKVPIANFAQSDKGPVLGMTAAQLDAAAGVKSSASTTATDTAAPAPQNAATNSSGETPQPQGGAMKLASGTSVVDGAGAPVGTIEAVSGEYATLATSKNKVRLPLTAFAMNGDNAAIGMTAAEIDAAAEAAKPKG